MKKLGILSGSDGSAIPETQDTGLYADRVVQFIGERHNGVWSTQIEKQYQDKYNENCPASGSKRLKQPTESELTAPFLGLVEHCFPRVLDKDWRNTWSFSCVYHRCSHKYFPTLSLRLIGEEFSEKFEDHLHYYDKEAIPRVWQPEVGNFWLPKCLQIGTE